MRRTCHIDRRGRIIYLHRQHTTCSGQLIAWAIQPETGDPVFGPPGKLQCQGAQSALKLSGSWWRHIAFPRSTGTAVQPAMSTGPGTPSATRQHGTLHA